MSAIPLAENHGILSYNLHPSIDHTTLSRGINPTQRHQPLRVVQPNGEDSVCLTDLFESAKRFKRENTELEEELVAGTPRIRGKRGKRKKRTRGSTNNDEPLSNRQKLIDMWISLEEFARSQVESQILLEDQMRRLDQDIEHFNKKYAEVLDNLAKFTGARMPAPLWDLLGMGRMEILQCLSLSSWEELAAGQDSDQLSHDIHRRLEGVSNSPSLSTLRFLSSYRGPHRGNIAVPTTTPEDVRGAVKSTPLDSYDRSSVEEIFLFVFGVAL